MKRAYQQRIDDLIGKNEIQISPKDETNQFINFLGSPDKDNYFKNEFDNMIKHLNSIYKNDASYNAFKKTIADIAEKKNCNGAYAELCAYDALNIEDFQPINLDVTLDNDLSYASKTRKDKTNLDGQIPNTEIYFDVKIFSDTVQFLLNGITQKFLGQHKLKTKPIILFEHPIEETEIEYQSQITDLKEEFSEHFSENCSDFKSIVHPGLIYKFNWGGIKCTEGFYNPYHRAEELCPVILSRYVNKFMLNKPFILVMVSFPWYNSIDMPWQNYNATMYRALTRRIFMQYRNSDVKMSEICTKFEGDETIYQVTKKLSGIMFIDVHSLKNEPDLNKKMNSPYKIFFYKNPFADNPIKSTYWEDSLSEKRDMLIDNFFYDIY